MAAVLVWLGDKVAPGLIVAAVVATPHYFLMRRHLNRQTTHFDEKTDAQTEQIHAAQRNDGGCE